MSEQARPGVRTVCRRGHVEFAGEVRDEPGIGNTLEFRLALDQTHLGAMIDQLDRAATAFPVIGRLDA